MAERANELFGEYAQAYARGERPAAIEYLARAGGEADELANLIDRFLARAPAPAPDVNTVELFEAWQAGESPLLRLRVAQGLRREAVVATLMKTLALDPAKERKVARYYHELESGLLDASGVDRRVWETLAKALGARVADLLAWRPSQLDFPATAFARASTPMAAMSVPQRAEEPPEEDEVDRLFRRSRAT